MNILDLTITFYDFTRKIFSYYNIHKSHEQIKQLCEAKLLATDLLSITPYNSHKPLRFSKLLSVF